MGLKIYSVENGKTPETEIVWLNTDERVNLKGYAVVDRTFAPDGTVSNEFRHIFVFPDITIEKDDWIRLHTSKGEYSQTRIKDKPGCYIHELYWGSDECVWNDNGGDIASLIKYQFINSVKVPATT